jgi:hypothetical protein
MLALLAAIAPATIAQVSLTTLGAAHTQNFDTLPDLRFCDMDQQQHDSGVVPRAHRIGHDRRRQQWRQQWRRALQLRHRHGYRARTGVARLGQRGRRQPVLGRSSAEQHGRDDHDARRVAYVGEQWRNSAATAHTVAFSYLVGSHRRSPERSPSSRAQAPPKRQPRLHQPGHWRDGWCPGRQPRREPGVAHVLDHRTQHPERHRDHASLVRSGPRRRRPRPVHRQFLGDAARRRARYRTCRSTTSR